MDDALRPSRDACYVLRLIFRLSTERTSSERPRVEAKLRYFFNLPSSKEHSIFVRRPCWGRAGIVWGDNWRDNLNASRRPWGMCGGSDECGGYNFGAKIKKLDGDGVDGSDGQGGWRRTPRDTNGRGGGHGRWGGRGGGL